MAATSHKTIVLVSGGNAGIGYEIVKKLAEQPTFHVLMGTRDTHKGEAAAASMGAPINVNPIQLDVTSDESIDLCQKTIAQTFGRLDILINNAGTAGKDLPNRASLPLRQVYSHCLNVNVTGAALLTEAMTPLLSQSTLPKVIFISSALGSIGWTLKNDVHQVPFYNVSKSADNYLTAYYSKLHEKDGWKVNACCPGYNATGLNDAVLSDATHPRNGAINAVRLALEGPDGVTGTYSNKEGPLPW